MIFYSTRSVFNEFSQQTFQNLLGRWLCRFFTSPGRDVGGSKSIFINALLCSGLHLKAWSRSENWKVVFLPNFVELNRRKQRLRVYTPRSTHSPTYSTYAHTHTHIQIYIHTHTRERDRYPQIHALSHIHDIFTRMNATWWYMHM